MIYQRGMNGTYWFRFRFAGRVVHESARTKLKTLARDAERQRRRELEKLGIRSSGGHSRRASNSGAAMAGQRQATSGRADTRYLRRASVAI